MKLTFPDGSIKEFSQGITGFEVARSISEGLARNALSIELDGTIQDLALPITKDAQIKILTWSEKGGQSTFWHSSAHLLAEALEALFPGTLFGIGPAIDNGFYYDVKLPDGEVLTQGHFEAIEKKMLELAKKKSVYERKEISKSDAIQYFKEKGDPFKLELLEDLEDGSITFYTQGNFTDLCRGPHIPDTSNIKAIKIMNVAGAYWRGDQSREQLTRIYGITFPKASLLTEYLERYEEAQKRDHRKIGKELGLFTFSEKVGLGLPLWLPKGTELRESLTNFLHKAQLDRGYQSVITPHIGHINLYKTSGHYEKYGADAFQPIKTPNEGEEFLLKPMNCPHHCEIYKSQPRSYKELPLRIAEFGTVYRYEQSGELHGLTRVRGFTQDDAHIFCTHDQIRSEFKDVIDLVLFVLKKLQFETFSAQVSVRDKNNLSKYIGDVEAWEEAEKQIIETAEEAGLQTVIEPGEAAFYGPKLDFMVQDALGRKWQLGTIQVDYNLPERFQLEYVAADNTKHRPVMIHRAPFGSMERMVALLIENCAGNFPFWLAPVQAMILPISEKYKEYAEKVVNVLKKSEIRTSIDNRDEKIGKKIREAEILKVPFMMIVGEKEMEEQNVSLRQHQKGEIGKFSLDELGDYFHSLLVN